MRKFKNIIKVPASITLALLLVMVAGAAKSLSPNEARKAIASIPGLDFDPNLVRIKSIEPGSGGAIVEAQFETAFWEKEVNVGRVSIPRSSVFLNHWLIARTGEEVVAREVSGWCEQGTYGRQAPCTT